MKLFNRRHVRKTIKAERDKIKSNNSGRGVFDSKGVRIKCIYYIDGLELEECYDFSYEVDYGHYITQKLLQYLILPHLDTRSIRCNTA